MEKINDFYSAEKLIDNHPDVKLDMSEIEDTSINENNGDSNNNKKEFMQEKNEKVNKQNSKEEIDELFKNE